MYSSYHIQPIVSNLKLSIIHISAATSQLNKHMESSSRNLYDTSGIVLMKETQLRRSRLWSRNLFKRNTSCQPSGALSRRPWKDISGSRKSITATVNTYIENQLLRLLIPDLLGVVNTTSGARDSNPCCYGDQYQHDDGYQ